MQMSNGYMLSAHGNPVLKTPRVDRLRAESRVISLRGSKPMNWDALTPTVLQIGSIKPKRAGAGARTFR